MLDKLPTILILGVLVGIFLALQRHSTTTRVRLWTYAWALIFVHFVIQLFEGPSGRFENIFEAIDLGALELSGLVFVISMSRFVEDRFYRRMMLIFLSVPTVFHATAVSLDWQMRWALVIALLMLTLAGGALILLGEGYRSPVAVIHATVILVAGAWAIRNQWRGNSALAFLAILTLTFATSGVWFWRGTKRWSPGVVAVAGGFLAWGAVFPMAALVARFFS